MKRSIGRNDILMYISSYVLLSDNTIIFHTKFAVPDMRNSMFGGLYIPSIIWDCD
ncbi:hypothetical protein ACE193_12560 [Bernardetia sp. OM2101]|uniref:hypothetical protein n=1 Tax=Bernardetia sp. OM2101 TaxID=3344876 RepID=UPI0035CE9D64